MNKGGDMSSKRSVIGARQVVPRVSILATLMCLVFFVGACTRQNSSAVRFASTSEPAANNGPINSGAANSSAPGPVISYADVLRRVSPAVITIHSQMRVRAPQQFPFMNDPMFRSARSEEHTSELQSRLHLVCRLLLEKKKKKYSYYAIEQ